MNQRIILSGIPLLIICILTVHIILPNVQAVNVSTTHYNVLAIEYSEVCKKLMDNHMKNTCPSLSELVKFDTSNKNISGKFIIKNGEVTRTNPQLINHYYWYNEMVVCVDCKVPLDKPDLFKVIFIEPSGFTYTYKTDEVKNNTWKSYKDRFTTPDCVTSMIGTTQNFDYLLNDTINYVLSGCTKTNIQVNQTNTLKQTIPDLNNSAQYKYDHWKDSIKKTVHLENCITKKCDIPTSPFTNTKFKK